jgi:ATP-dependent Clp protease ATP-binding subunit ClpC
MFERFSDQARRVVVQAQEEARLLSHNYIGTEHLLLGLLRERDGTAAEALGSLGVSLDDARAQTEEIIGRGQHQASGHIPFTPRAKKVLELSLPEARRLGHRTIGTEHILLGMLREGEGVAAQVLVRLGVDLNMARQAVIGLAHGSPGVTSEPVVENIRVAARPRPAADFAARLDGIEEQLARLAAEVERLSTVLRDHGLDSGGGTD